MKKLGLVYGLLALSAALATGCVAETGEPGDVENVDSTGMSWEEFKANAYQEPDTGVYIVDGDTPMFSEAELEAFYLEHVQQGALAVMTSGGSDVKWDSATALNITYCISTGFGSRYSAVVNAMNTATGAWEGAANVNFVHKSDQDANCSAQNKNVIFDVRPVNVGGQYLARAFFPNTSRNGRNVLIDNTAFTSQGISLDGVLRHELGHTLGFRHEHTRPEAGACFEDNNWRGLTPYDSSSVMHYPQCNGTNSWALTLTSQDKAGAALLYGAPGSGGGSGGGGKGNK
ncbi:M57 family metalloprotease [Polyangium sp. y55x31]|uniref:M57 family metalloprotease n=1 Tax=Polyangium sp. y55x31 TaxID=3042688 RepID=UPI0024821D28|nr:M57 family metalloprotease [Polyangium sp. y55x31]MDI1479130.1 M57 family metalloprotease [Polyangium sp. y55x31]